MKIPELLSHLTVSDGTEPSRLRNKEEARHTRQVQEPNCSLLQLSTDIILLISQELPPFSRVLLSQICCSLREVLGPLSAVTLSRSQRLEYLAALARDLPDQWVCEVCVALHRMNNLDVPTAPEHMTCPRGWRVWLLGAYGIPITQSRHDAGRVRLDHRHIQLALKCIRLKQDCYRSYVQKLLAPYHNDSFAAYGFPSTQPKPLTAQYSVYPKVVLGRDGGLRYLTLSVWKYHRNHRPVSLDAMGYFNICPHLFLRPDLPPQPHCPLDTLGRAINAALRSRNDTKQQHGACPRCPTDFSVQASPDRAKLLVWQDLGPEGSPMDLAWRSHVFDIGKAARNFRSMGLILDHAPGSVRKLYYSTGFEEATRLPSCTYQ